LVGFVSPPIQDRAHTYLRLVPDGEAGATWPALCASAHDTVFLALIFVMLLWPWIFLAVIWCRNGVQASNHLATIVTDHPHSVSFFITFLGNMVNLIVGVLFSLAIVRYAQDKVANNKDITSSTFQFC
jgi:hypothetical protein